MRAKFSTKELIVVFDEENFKSFSTVAFTVETLIVFIILITYFRYCFYHFHEDNRFNLL